jgi:hypothetical protein
LGVHCPFRAHHESAATFLQCADGRHVFAARAGHASVGAACSCDTFLVTGDGPLSVTPTQVWPLKRIRVQGAEFLLPDLLLR